MASCAGYQGIPVVPGGLQAVEPDPAAEGMPLVTERIDNAGIRTAMSNSFGFGGTNATLVLQRD